MASDLYKEMSGFDANGFMKSVNDLKSKGGDPNQMIQNLLNSGKVTQEQVNRASALAQRIMPMLPLGDRQR